MIKIDQNYCEFRDDSDPNYPGGKAIDAPTGDSIDGTQIKADLINTIMGFFQAVIIKAYNHFIVSGEPDNAYESEILEALVEIVIDTFNEKVWPDKYLIIQQAIELRLTDAPINNRAFGRMNGGWADVIPGTRQELEAIIQAMTKFLTDAPLDNKDYVRRNGAWREIIGGSGSGGDGEGMGLFHELYKTFSKKSLMITNRKIADRRFVGWDIGLPYLVDDSRVYHFDTDLKDQKQESNIIISDAGEAPILRGRDDTNGQIYFNPAVLDNVPYEMLGRSLHGHFSLATQLPAIDTFTVETWIRFFNENNAILLRLDSGNEIITFMLTLEDPEYSEPGIDGIEYSISMLGDIPYTAGELATGIILYSLAGDDDILYSVAGDDNIPYSVGSNTSGSMITHIWQGGIETADIDDSEFEISNKTWLHIAVVSTPAILSLYIGKSKVDFIKQNGAIQQFSLILNEGKNEFNIDEFSINPGIALNFNDFVNNTDARIPYAALDYRKKWFVLEAQDPALVKTNLFDTEQFKTAVQAIINNQ